jgi:RNase H-fold protein (predicted Holliday junction resolvase)
MVRGSEKLIVAIDPGSVKCGIAILDYDGSLVEGISVNRSVFIRKFEVIFSSYSPQKCVIGNGTSSKALIMELEASFSLSIEVIDEFGSTLEARKLWAEHEWSSGIFKYVPLLIKTLFEPSSLDSYAAWALGLRFLKQNTKLI